MIRVPRRLAPLGVYRTDPEDERLRKATLTLAVTLMETGGQNTPRLPWRRRRRGRTDAHPSLRITPAGWVSYMRTIYVGVDRALGRATGVDPKDAMKVRFTRDHVDAIGKDLPAYDAFDIGAFVCSPALFDAVEKATDTGDSSLAGAVQVLADTGAARPLSLADQEWWFDVDTPTDHLHGSRHLFRGTGKPLDGPVAAHVNRTVSQRLVTPVLLAPSHRSPRTRSRSEVVHTGHAV